MKSLTKRFVSSVLSVAMAISTVPIVSAHAEESTDPYPYRCLPHHLMMVLLPLMQAISV